MTERVLFVDDDPNVLAAYRRALRKCCSLVTAEGGEQGLAALKADGPFAVVISDQQMPGMDGVSFLREAKTAAPMTVRMMLTGNADQQTAIDAVNEGDVFRFHTKPCPPEELARSIDAAAAHHRLMKAEKELLEQTLAGSVKVLVDVLSLADPAAFQRTALIRRWAAAVAARLGVDNLWELDIAVMLAPIGRVTLPAEVRAKLDRAARLTDAEAAIVGRMPEAGRNLIANIPRLTGVADAVLYQHKWFDGSGFPEDERAGGDIPLVARLIHVLTDLADRTGGREPEIKHIDLMAAEQGRFDPTVLNAARAALAASGERRAVAGADALILPFDEVAAGDEVAEDLTCQDGTLILAAGQELSGAMIEKIQAIRQTKPLAEPVKVLRRSGGDQPARADAG